MIPYSLSATGWFSKINGRLVQARNLTQRLPGSAMPWAAGHPIGVLWHYTDGFSGDISGSMIADNYITAQLSIGRDGTIYQYSDIWTAHWHAYAASQWGIGVEHEAHPPDSNITDVQLEASVDVFAAIIDAVRQKYAQVIPVEHITGCDLTRPGLKEHADGLGCSWDPKGHSDKLYGWGWPAYLGAITKALQGGEDDVTGDDIVKGWRTRLHKEPLPDDADDGFQVGWHVRDIVEKGLHLPVPPAAGLKDHTHDEPAHQTGGVHRG